MRKCWGDRAGRHTGSATAPPSAPENVCDDREISFCLEDLKAHVLVDS